MDINLIEKQGVRNHGNNKKGHKNTNKLTVADFSLQVVSGRQLLRVIVPFENQGREGGAVDGYQFN